MGTQGAAGSLPQEEYSESITQFAESGEQRLLGETPHPRGGWCTRCGGGLRTGRLGWHRPGGLCGRAHWFGENPRPVPPGRNPFGAIPGLPVVPELHGHPHSTREDRCWSRTKQGLSRSRTAFPAVPPSSSVSRSLPLPGTDAAQSPSRGHAVTLVTRCVSCYRRPFIDTVRHP